MDPNQIGPAVGRRDPGDLPNILEQLSLIRQAAAEAPTNLRPIFHKLVEGIYNWAFIQARLNQRLWESHNSLPSKHAATHTGGDDSVMFTGLPTSITLGSVGDPGTPQLGASPGDHEHPTIALGALSDLLDLDVGPQGVPVTDGNAQRELEEILAKLLALYDLLLRLLDLLGIKILDEGVVQGIAQSMDFTGAGVVATVVGSKATVAVTGGGGSTPTGTGFRHVVGGVEDAAAKLVDTADVNDNQITYAKMQDISAASRLLGRGSAAGAGDPEEITLGTNLSMAGTTLNASGGGSGLTHPQVMARVSMRM